MDIRDLKVFQMIAFEKSVSKAANMGYPMPFLQYVVLIETIIAVILVVYIYPFYGRDFWRKEIN